MAELTPAGYKLKTLNEWYDDERQLYLDIDPLWNLDPSTPDGLKLAHDAEVFGALDETLQQAYNSKDPAKAVGYDLDVLCALTGTTRSKGTPSNVTVTLTGTPGTVVAAGSLIKSRTTGTSWTIDQTVTLTAGTATVGATCTVVGPTQADAGTLTQIATTVGGWTGVTNPSPATPGTDAQDDASLRIERNTAVGRPGNNQVDSTLGELYAVDGVRRVKAYENDTGAVDSNGLPAHSMAYIVDGGADADVAMAIYLKKNPGVALYQAATPVSVTVTSPKYPTNQKVVKFSRPIAIDMVIAVTVKDDGSLPSTVSDEIKDAIVHFGAGTLIDPACGFVADGFDIGESVPYFTVSTPVNKVLGSYGNSYIQTLTVNGGTTNVAVPFNKISRWTSGNITVVITP